MAKSIDLIVTWPKTRPLESYLESLEWAARNGLQINFRVSRRPGWEPGALYLRPARCYRVHDGAIRGYTDILYTCHRGEGEVAMIGEEGYWPAGEYITCDPKWFQLRYPVPMRGFQGWRWVPAELMAKLGT